MAKKAFNAGQLIPTSSTPPSNAGFYRIDKNTIGVVGNLVQKNAQTNAESNVASGANLAAELATIGAPTTTYGRFSGVELSAFYSRDIADYSVAGTGGVIAMDTSVRRSGAQTLKVTCNGGAGAANTDLIFSHTWPNITVSNGRLGVWVYITDHTLLTSINFRVGHGAASLTNGAFQTYSFSETDKSYNGWHFVGFNKSQYTGVYGTPDWSSHVGMVKLTIKQATDSPAYLYFDKLVAGWESKAKIVIMADDGRVSWFNYGIPILDSLGLKSTAAIIGATIDSGGTIATSAQLASAYAAGHDLCPHGATALDDVSFTSDAQRLSDVLANKSYLENRGYTRGASFYVYPNGKYRIPGNEQAIINVVKSAGIAAARTTSVPAYTNHGVGLSDKKYLLPVIGVFTETVADIKSRIDSAIEYGATCFLMYHSLVLTGAASSTDRNISDFVQEMEYIAAKRGAGLCDVVTVSQWLNCDY